jgi:hypothetical protein
VRIAEIRARALLVAGAAERRECLVEAPLHRERHAEIVRAQRGVALILAQRRAEQRLGALGWPARR